MRNRSRCRRWLGRGVQDRISALHVISWDVDASSWDWARSGGRSRSRNWREGRSAWAALDRDAGVGVALVGSAVDGSFATVVTRAAVARLSTCGISKILLLRQNLNSLDGFSRVQFLESLLDLIFCL